jgi:hypothetical protein
VQDGEEFVATRRDSFTKNSRAKHPDGKWIWRRHLLKSRISIGRLRSVRRFFVEIGRGSVSTPVNVIANGCHARASAIVDLRSA